MKITESYIHIPPYVSTTWSGVHAIWKEKDALCLSILGKQVIAITGLSDEQEKNIFSFHQKHLSAGEKKRSIFDGMQNPFSFNFGGSPANVQFGLAGPGGVQNIMEHNPSLAHLPDLPLPLLERIVKITEAATQGVEGVDFLEAEPHCNCPHCQLARVIHKTSSAASEDVSEEEVADDELEFSDWEIKATGEGIYKVANKLDGDQVFSVSLGNLVGCTCGKEGCEHLLAVLRSYK